jgi:dTDP-4-amino-4,6-dideoxygalactose transaminase
MEKREISFSPPDITDLEIAEVIRTLKSGWITTGPRTKLFEKKIAAYCGTGCAVALNSATACLEAVLRLLEIGEGDEVITSAYTYTASASPVCHVGAKLVLVDVSKDGYEMDYDALENAITGKTKAVIPVDLGGVPCDYERIFEIVEKKKAMFHPTNGLQEAIGRVAVIADSAHAFGAKKLIGRSWKMCGAIADFTSFSFHAVKNLTTAEGGALTWRRIEGIDDDWIYQQLMLLSLHGQSKDALAKNKLGAWEYDITFPGYKWNMTDIMGAIGLKQLERYPDILKKRRRIIETYDKAFQPLGIQVRRHFEKGQMSSGHLYLMRIPGIGEAERNQIISHLAGEGIASNVHYKPLPMMTAYRELGFDMKDYPNAYRQYENEITLPLHTCLKNEDVEYIITKVIEVVQRYGEIDHAV